MGLSESSRHSFSTNLPTGTSRRYRSVEELFPVAGGNGRPGRGPHSRGQHGCRHGHGRPRCIRRRPGATVNHGGGVRPGFPYIDVDDVGERPPAGCTGGEAVGGQVGCGGRRGVGPGARRAAAAGPTRLRPAGAQEIVHQFGAGVDAPASVRRGLPGRNCRRWTRRWPRVPSEPSSASLIVWQVRFVVSRSPSGDGSSTRGNQLVTRRAVRTSTRRTGVSRPSMNPYFSLITGPGRGIALLGVFRNLFPVLGSCISCPLQVAAPVRRRSAAAPRRRASMTYATRPPKAFCRPLYRRLPGDRTYPASAVDHFSAIFFRKFPVPLGQDRRPFRTTRHAGRCPEISGYLGSLAPR